MITVKSARPATEPTPEEVKARIGLALKRLAALDAARIDVEIVNGKAILRGKVHSLTEREEAERVARSAPGVYEVDNQIVVEP